MDIFYLPWWILPLLKMIEMDGGTGLQYLPAELPLLKADTAWFEHSRITVCLSSRQGNFSLVHGKILSIEVYIPPGDFR